MSSQVGRNVTHLFVFDVPWVVCTSCGYITSSENIGS